MHPLMIVAGMMIVPMWAGVILLVASTYSYSRRTQDWSIFKRLWTDRGLLTEQESRRRSIGTALFLGALLIGAPCLLAVRYQLF